MPGDVGLLDLQLREGIRGDAEAGERCASSANAVEIARPHQPPVRKGKLVPLPHNKKHHFVSQFYLRNFGTGNSISLFNIARRRHIARAPIPGQCQRSYLYGSDNVREAELAALEGAACAVIRAILASETPPERGGDAHRSLANYISVQLGRTPDAAAAVELSHTKMYRGVAKDFARRNGLAEDRFAGVKPPPGLDPLRTSLGISEQHGALLLDLRMKVLRSSGAAFVTSDLPVVLYNQWARHYTASGVRGLTCSGLLVLLPLSPRSCLFLFDDAVYGTAKTSACIDLADDDVNSVNAAQLLGAECNLYYSPDAATQRQIDKLPLHWSRPRSERIHLRRARSEDDRSTLLYFFESQPDVSLKFRFLRQLGRAKEVPLHERGRSWRPAAVAESRRLGIGVNRPQRRGLKPGATWRVFAEE